MKPHWNQDLFYKAFQYAAKAHHGQKVSGSELPYIIHISTVCAELMAFLDETVDSDLAIQCAALHDTIEDTETSYNDIFSEFGKNVADGVLALSKDKTVEKHLAIHDSLSRIKMQPKEIWMVKLADRITNMNPPPSFWKQEKIIEYKGQAIAIYEALKEGHEGLANRLKEKIEKYGS